MKEKGLFQIEENTANLFDVFDEKHRAVQVDCGFDEAVDVVRARSRERRYKLKDLDGIKSIGRY